MAHPQPGQRRLAEVPPEYGLWSNEYVDGLRRQRNALLDALNQLVQAADPSWEQARSGHDWTIALEHARRLIGELPSSIHNQP